VHTGHGGTEEDPELEVVAELAAPTFDVHQALEDPLEERLHLVFVAQGVHAVAGEVSLEASGKLSAESPVATDGALLRGPAGPAHAKIYRPNGAVATRPGSAARAIVLSAHGPPRPADA